MLTRILVADDHPSTVRGIREILRGLPAQVEVTFAPDGVRMRVAQERFDLLVLDVSFRGSDVTGFHLLREVQQLHPELPVLIHSMYDDPSIQDAAKREGARGFISKSAPQAKILEATSAVLAGETFFSATRSGTSLSDRQLEVSEGLRSGLHEKEVAAELGLSLSMVQGHARKAKKAVKARSIMQLVALFVEKGFRFLPRRRKDPTD